jgi:hypothetical protein
MPYYARMTVKDQVIQVLRHLPADASLDDIQYKLHVIASVLKGKSEISSGGGISHAQAKKRLGRRWNIK